MGRISNTSIETVKGGGNPILQQKQITGRKSNTYIETGNGGGNPIFQQKQVRREEIQYFKRTGKREEKIQYFVETGKKGGNPTKSGKGERLSDSSNDFIQFNQH